MSPSAHASRRKGDIASASSDVAPRSNVSFPITCVASSSLATIFNAEISVCDVTMGPTCSWKDCVAPGVIESAQRQRLRRVVVASSGNHGRAIAYACRAAGLEAAILVYDRTPSDVVDSLVGLGAEVYTFPDRPAVHAAMDVFISEGWFSATLPDRLRNWGSMPGGNGYQRIARAIVDAVDGDPIVIVPTCYGDGASSIRRHIMALGRDPIMCLVRATDADGSIAASIATNVLTPQVACLLASDAVDITVEDGAFRAGLETMEVALGKPLDCAEGGIPAALARLSAMAPSASARPIVCVVTGGVFPGLEPVR